MSNRPLPPRLSVVAVVWNARDELEPFLESVLAQVDPATTEIVLVDNGSTDGSREILRERPEVVLIENDRNSGFGAGLNLGCAHATSPRLLLCNPDLEFRPGAIDALVATLDAEPALGGVGPIIRIEGGGVCPLLRGHPGITYGWSFFTGLMAKFPRSRWINAHFDHDPARRSHRQPWLHGCCGLYRRDAFRAIGGFDERFFLYFEDCDLGRRLTEAGWRLALAPDAEVQHREGGSTAKASLATRRSFVESWHHYHHRHSSAPYRAVAHLTVAVAISLQVGLQIAKRLMRRANDLETMATYAKAHFACWLGRRGARRSDSLRPSARSPVEFRERRPTAR